MLKLNHMEKGSRRGRLCMWAVNPLIIIMIAL